MGSSPSSDAGAAAHTETGGGGWAAVRGGGAAAAGALAATADVSRLLFAGTPVRLARIANAALVGAAGVVTWQPGDDPSALPPHSG